MKGINTVARSWNWNIEFRFWLSSMRVTHTIHSFPRTDRSPLHLGQQEVLSSSAKRYGRLRSLGVWTWTKCMITNNKRRECCSGCISFLAFFSFLYVFFIFFLREWMKKEIKLSTGTRIYSHVGVDFKHYIFVFIKEKDAEGRHLLRDTAWLRNAWDNAHCPHYALDGGMVRGLQSLKQRTKKGLMTFFRGNGFLLTVFCYCFWPLWRRIWLMCILLPFL